MILGINSSTPVLELWLDDTRYDIEIGRDLSRDLLKIIHDQLALTHPDTNDDQLFKQLTGIIVFRGPGSFTGLRIGATIANTLADSLSIPIVGTTDEDWHKTGINRLKNDENDHLILPLYGAAPNISTPRK